MTYERCFYTQSALPLVAFSVMGLSAKPNSTSPIGEFGTGLKLAVAATLREGGKFQMFIDGVEYEFYIKDVDFRGMDHNRVALRKRNGITRKLTYIDMPFTLNYGRNLSAWQVYRELASNTFDEGGIVFGPEDLASIPQKGTLIRVSMPGLREAVEEGEVFFQPDEDSKSDIVFEDSVMTAYRRPSRHMYYRGVRVHTYKNPSKFTYDFKKGTVELTEDRSPKNLWGCYWHIARCLMTRDVPQKDLRNLLTKHKDAPEALETNELSYHYEGLAATDTFKQVVTALAREQGQTSTNIITLSAGLHHASYRSTLITVRLKQEQCKRIHEVLTAASETDLAKLFAVPSSEDDVPF